MGNYNLPLEHRQKISSSLKGKPKTEEHKRKISEALKGHPGLEFTEESRKKMSESQKGRKHSEETRMKMSETRKRIHLENPDYRNRIGDANRGRVPSQESRDRQSKLLKGRFTGKKSFNWKGGRAIIVPSLRDTRDYRIWRRAVLERDNHTCVSCGCKDGTLHVHHIISISDDITKALDISNGETLCIKCHQKEHPFNLYMGRMP
jgi:hypothetical protein